VDFIATKAQIHTFFNYGARTGTVFEGAKAELKNLKSEG